ncbi:Pvc16 family protein [Burkholderiaceae bacterium UC74_6]
MIDDLDRSLVKLLELEFGSPLPFDLSFAVPDKAFTPVSKQRSTLNCYLYDIRENRDLRDVGRYLERHPGGQYSLDAAPCRVKASYCITAWSPAEATPGIDPHLDEHNLLAAVLRVLLRYPELPRPVLVGTMAAQKLPPPTLIAQPDSARNSGDFWNAIGGQLRPSLEYAVSIALDYQAGDQGPLVTDVLARVGARDGDAARLLQPADPQYQVGGTVWSGSSPTATPVAGAWVRVDETGELAVADDAGQFRVQRVEPGLYTLRVRATGFQEGTRPLPVPLNAGSYDIHLDPL